MKFYVVGFTQKERVGAGIYGDALVWAENNSDALSRVRKTGWIPNPGDRFLVPASGRFPEGHWMSDIVIEDWMRQKAMEDPNGVYEVWISSEDDIKSRLGE